MIRTILGWLFGRRQPPLTGKKLFEQHLNQWLKMHLGTTLDRDLEEAIDIVSRQAVLQVCGDMVAGRVPLRASSFSELHDYVDANYYGFAFEWPALAADMDEEYQCLHLKLFNRVQENVDSWLKAKWWTNG